MPQSTLQSGKYYYILASVLEAEIQRNSVTCQAKVGKEAPAPLKHWFSLWLTVLNTGSFSVLSSHPVWGWAKFPIQNNCAGMMHSRETKTAQICID